MKNDLKFIKTEDNSTGLFSSEINDIFHSKTGALTEARQKFIEPIKNFYQNKNKITVLDICYGIGYNSKAILNEFNNKEIEIDALEFNKDYTLISPFINDCINDYELKLFLLKEIEKETSLKSYYEILKDYKNENEEFFDVSISFMDSFISKMPYKNILHTQNNSNLHNIYYNYISNSMMYSINDSKYNNSSIKFHIGDARLNIENLYNKYDVVFLDAFSSQKDPTLWTIDFLSKIKDKMNNDSMLVTYSKSTPFRSALLQLGFFVGKTFIDEIDMGTVASFNKNKIINPLSDYDMQLIKTRSGIVYKDPTFSLSSTEILKNREFEQKNSNLISHTQFLKNLSK